MDRRQIGSVRPLCVLRDKHLGDASKEDDRSLVFDIKAGRRMADVHDYEKNWFAQASADFEESSTRSGKFKRVQSTRALVRRVFWRQAPGYSVGVECRIGLEPVLVNCHREKKPHRIQYCGLSKCV